MGPPLRYLLNNHQLTDFQVSCVAGPVASTTPSKRQRVKNPDEGVWVVKHGTQCLGAMSGKLLTRPAELGAGLVLLTV